MMVQKGIAFQLWLFWVSILCQISRSYPNILIGSACFKLQASPASQVLAESERNRADLAVAYGQHLNVNHQKPAVEMGFKKNFLETCYFNATGGRENVQNFGSYAIIPTYDTDVCVCVCVHYDGP